MASADPGPVLYAYKPIPANPMSVAVLVLLVVVTFVLGPLAAAPEGWWPLGGLCFAPIAVVLLIVFFFAPSPTVIYEDGIRISLPRWRRIVSGERDFRWQEIRDVYPASYEVAGSFMSPFASSAGTLVHVGIGLETNDGRRRIVRFTPGSIRTFRAESQAYQDAMATIRDRFARHGDRMVTTARPLSDSEVLAMEDEARKPLVSIVGVFFAFFLPPTIVALGVVLVSAAGFGLGTPLLIGLVVLAALPPAYSMLSTLRRSRHRNEILSDLSKFQESLREGSRSR